MRVTKASKQRTTKGNAMEIIITSQSQEDGRVYFELSSGKKDADISYNAELGMVRVLCKNASHKVWKGVGRTFWSFEEARAAYKSRDMQAMIDLVEAECGVAA